MSMNLARDDVTKVNATLKGDLIICGVLLLYLIVKKNYHFFPPFIRRLVILTVMEAWKYIKCGSPEFT